MTTMLYKCPGPHAIHGGHYDYTIVEDDEIEETLAAGWHLTTPEAKQAHDDAMAAQAQERTNAVEAEAARTLADATTPPTRAELEQMAMRLSISFSARTSDKKLRAQIEAATAPDAPAEE